MDYDLWFLEGERRGVREGSEGGGEEMEEREEIKRGEDNLSLR